MKSALLLSETSLPKSRRWIPVALAVLLVSPAVVRAQCTVGSDGPAAASLALRLKEGDTRRAMSTSDQTTTQTVMGQQQTSHQVTKMGVRYDVLKAGEDGRRRVRVTYESMSLDATTPMGRMSWSSADTAGTVPQGAEIFSALLGHGYTVAMDADGTNRHVEGWDSLVSELMDAIPSQPGSSAEDTKKMLEQNVGESMIGGALKDVVAVMPSKTAGVGDTWSCTSRIGGGMGLTNTSTWTVGSRAGGVTTMKVISELASDSTASSSMGGMTVRYALHGTTTTTVDIEDATGWILRSRSEGEISGTASVDGSPMGPLDIPMSIKTVNTTEPVGS